MTIREITSDNAMTWSVREALKTALDQVTDTQSQMVIVLRDQRSKETQIIQAGTDQITSIGLLHVAQSLILKDMNYE